VKYIFNNFVPRWASCIGRIWGTKRALSYNAELTFAFAAEGRSNLLSTYYAIIHNNYILYVIFTCPEYL
jgi:hypothetical protein